MVKPGEKRPASRQKSIVDLFQKPATTTRGISDRSKTPSSVVGQNNELSPSLPGENIELSPSLPGENNELSPSSVVGQNNELSPSLPGENIELSPPLPGENNELSPSSVVAEHRGPSCPLVVGENPTFSSSKPQSDTKLPKASTLSNWRQIYEWLEITERNTMICKICVSQKEQIILKNPSSPMGFIHGASNFKSSALKEYSTSECHLSESSLKRHNLSEVWNKLIYLSADGASVNSRKESGLIAQIRAEHEWVLFVWCFSHRLELALKEKF